VILGQVSPFIGFHICGGTPSTNRPHINRPYSVATWNFLAAARRTPQESGREYRIATDTDRNTPDVIYQQDHNSSGEFKWLALSQTPEETQDMTYNTTMRTPEQNGREHRVDIQW